MIGELFFNGKDAYKEWGVDMDEKGFSALFNLSAMKSPTENKSADTNGKDVRPPSKDSPALVDERTLNLTISVHAKNRAELFAKVESLEEELIKQRIEITTCYNAKVYRCDYLDCQQMTSLLRRVATYNLKLNEPNPANRGKENITDYADNDI